MASEIVTGSVHSFFPVVLLLGSLHLTEYLQGSSTAIFRQLPVLSVPVKLYI
jgi:hypothetical protein